MKKLFTSATITIFLLAACTPSVRPVETQFPLSRSSTPEVMLEGQVETITVYTFTPSPTETPCPTPLSTVSTYDISCIPDNPPEMGIVYDIVDGDTIKVLIDDNVYTVRYIGVKAPEYFDYFGPEARENNLRLVNGKTVSMIKDASDTDQDGNLLRYVIADNVFVNYELALQGSAIAASDNLNFSCAFVFQSAQQQANSALVGLWITPTLSLFPSLTIPTTISNPVSTKPYSNPAPTAKPSRPSSCCKVCGATSKPCGDSCISLSYTCHKPPGCACDG